MEKRAIRRRRVAAVLTSLVVLAGVVAACNAVTRASGRPSTSTRPTSSTRPTTTASTSTNTSTNTSTSTSTSTTAAVPATPNVGIHTFHWDETGPGITHVGPTGAPIAGRVLTTEIRYPSFGGSPARETTNAAPATQGGPYPVIVFAHGFMTDPSTYTALLDTWVRAGFVVVSPIFPDENLQAVRAAGGMTSRTIADNLEDDVYNEPGDIVYVLEQLQSLAAQPWGGHLKGVMDLNDVGLAGQSDGANVVAALSYASGLRGLYDDLPSAPKAVAVLSGYAWDYLPDGDIGQYVANSASPALLQVQSDADGCVSPAAAADLFATVQSGLRSKWFVTLLGADHLGPYRGVAPWAAVVDSVTTQFFELELKGKSSSASARSIVAAGTVVGASQVTTEVNGSTMPQVPLVGGC